MKQKSTMKVGVLASSNYITVLVNTILFPVFPAMASALNLSLRDLALLVGIVSFPAAILNLVGGILADRLGRKVIIVASLILYGLGGLLIGIAVIIMSDPWPVMLIGRFIQGIGAATPMFLTIALVGDLFSGLERSKSLGFLETANGLGKISSPILGGAVGLISWYAIFFIYPIVAFPVAIATWFVIKEPSEKEKIDWEKNKKAFLVFKNVSRSLTLLAAFASIFFLIGTMFWMSDFLEARLQFNQFVRGLIISIPAVAMVITTLFAEVAAKRSNPRYVIGLGILLMTLGIFLLAFTLETVFFWVVIVIIGCGAGLTLPSVDTVSTSVKTKNIRGTVATIFGSLRSLGGALAPIIFSLLLDIDLKLTFFVIAGGGLFISIIILLFLKPKDVLPPKDAES